MNPKKLNILEAAIHLFADKGFHATSIQEIADESGVSKGTIYLYFSSKNELITSLFSYYHEELQKKIKKIDGEIIGATERFERKIYVYLEELWKRKELIMLQIREQSLTVDETTIEVIQTIRHDIFEADKKMLLDMYGEDFRPYLVDGALLLESIRASVHQLLLLDHIEVTIDRLAAFIMHRMDELANGMIDKRNAPLLNERMFREPMTETDQQKSAKEALIEMERKLEVIDLPDDRNSELQGAIDFLYEEISKTTPQSFIIKGMLANFRNIPEMKETRLTLASRLEITLDD
ncbi:TetR/AcrR family transcriptional regulator [Salimicrobium halophilum]|uniref:DNA-binding transcriptional regulator, AcrR family n=1 Tax=Salimicrobium halophilum TaxID=86666 RepID=A0A1G8R2K5_9BACI|nr:TetR/AcrR family transcriptional regulator [Salimicrobium halophilum]SDJ10630.1 DNA-binding transcriptional regulator, AcrR family [Salimicrobium halophilum]